MKDKLTKTEQMVKYYVIARPGVSLDELCSLIPKRKRGSIAEAIKTLHIHRKVIFISGWGNPPERLVGQSRWPLFSYGPGPDVARPVLPPIKRIRHWKEREPKAKRVKKTYKTELSVDAALAPRQLNIPSTPYRTQWVGGKYPGLI